LQQRPNPSCIPRQDVSNRFQRKFSVRESDAARVGRTLLSVAFDFDLGNDFDADWTRLNVNQIGDVNRINDPTPSTSPQSFASIAPAN
ncbi:MAG: hypothetical protein WAU92_10950, partial [Candidatus Sulfotelmatobacter sp.]